MYDVRCTTRTTAVSAYGQRGCAAPQGRTGRVVPVSQLRCSRALRGDAKLVRRDGGQTGAAHVRSTMYDLEVRARCADFFGALMYAEISLGASS